MFVPRSTCLCAPCLCLDLLVHVLLAMLRFRSICSCATYHVYVFRSTCLDAMASAFIAFYLLLCLFLVFWPLGRM